MSLKTRIAAALGVIAVALVPTFTAGAVVGSNANGEIQMLSPHQKIHFNVNMHTLEYWNYDYPEGTSTLHYVSTITCSSIDLGARTARFMWQIPEGHPGLRGLYVIAMVKIVDVSTKQYLYGHTASADLATATGWCQTGVGFAPAMYQVKSGVLYIKPPAAPPTT